MKEDDAFDVFVSYAHEDTPWVEENLHVPLASTRTREGWPPRIFVDTAREGIRGGENFKHRLATSIQNCRKFLPVYSERYFAKEWTMWEMDLAQLRDPGGRRGIICPIMFDPSARNLIPNHLQLIQCIMVADFPDWFERLCGSLELVPGEVAPPLRESRLDQLARFLRENGRKASVVGGSALGLVLLALGLGAGVESPGHRRGAIRSGLESESRQAFEEGRVAEAAVLADAAGRLAGGEGPPADLSSALADRARARARAFGTATPRGSCEEGALSYEGWAYREEELPEAGLAIIEGKPRRKVELAKEGYVEVGGEWVSSSGLAERGFVLEEKRKVWIPAEEARWLAMSDDALPSGGVLEEEGGTLPWPELVRAGRAHLEGTEPFSGGSRPFRFVEGQAEWIAR